MSNIFLTPSIIARESLALLQSNLVTPHLFSRQYETDLNRGSKVGDTISIRRRSKGVVDEYNGTSVIPRDVQETSMSIKLEKHFDATIRITDRERTLSIEQFSEQVLAPRMIEMGEKIDSYALSKLLLAPNPAGSSFATPAALPTSVSDLAQMDKTLNDLKAPMAPRYQIASTELKAALLSIPNIVQYNQSGSTDALRLASLGPIMNFQTYMGQNVPTATFTSGTMTSCVSNTGSGVVTPKGSKTIVYDGANGATVTLIKGDIISIAGYGFAVIAANVTSSSSSGTLTIEEPLREDVADNVVITVYDGGGNTRACHGCLFHPNAFAFVAVPLDLPMGTPAEYVEDPATNLALRTVYTYDRDLKSDVLSIDILVGAQMVDGRLCAQVIKNI